MVVGPAIPKQNFPRNAQHPADTIDDGRTGSCLDVNNTFGVSCTAAARLRRAPETIASTPLLRILALYEILWRLRKDFVSF